MLADWTDELVSSAEILRLIYQGRFLHGNVTLAALGLPTGKTTVMHLVPRESLPEPNSQGQFRSLIVLFTPFVCISLFSPLQMTRRRRRLGRARAVARARYSEKNYDDKIVGRKKRRTTSLIAITIL